VKRVVLRNSGQHGIAGHRTTKPSTGRLSFYSNGLRACWFEGPVTCQHTVHHIPWRINGITTYWQYGAASLRVVGLILTTNTGAPIFLLARIV